MNHSHSSTSLPSASIVNVSKQNKSNPSLPNESSLSTSLPRSRCGSKRIISAPLIEGARELKRHPLPITLTDGEYSSTPDSNSKTRTITKTLLIIPKLLLCCITVPLCVALEVISGFSTGLIVGSILASNALKHGGLKLAIPLSLFVMPASLVLGAGVAIMGFFSGAYDGACLGWSFNYTEIKDTYTSVNQRLHHLAS